MSTVLLQNARNTCFFFFLTTTSYQSLEQRIHWQTGKQKYGKQKYDKQNWQTENHICTKRFQGFLKKQLILSWGTNEQNKPRSDCLRAGNTGTEEHMSVQITKSRLGKSIILCSSTDKLQGKENNERVSYRFKKI